MVLWELLTTEAPYRDVDQAAIIYGVGTNRLHLPLPPTVPGGLLLLLQLCWTPKPRNRPPFSVILLHMSIASADLLRQDPDQYANERYQWKQEFRSRQSDNNRRPASVSSNENVNVTNMNYRGDDLANRLAQAKIGLKDDDPAVRVFCQKRLRDLTAEMASIQAILDMQDGHKPR